MTTTPEIILQIKDLVKVYHDKNKAVRALDGLNLDIYRGEILALLGVNGAGKTTLSSILVTLNPPTEGDILFNGTSIYKNLSAYRHILGFCPQRPNLDYELTVEENLFFAGRYYLVPDDVLYDRVKFPVLNSQAEFRKHNDNTLHFKLTLWNLY